MFVLTASKPSVLRSVAFCSRVDAMQSSSVVAPSADIESFGKCYSWGKAVSKPQRVASTRGLDLVAVACGGRHAAVLTGMSSFD